MSLASRAGDLFYTFRFVKMLTTPFDETDAFKLGLIDKDGKRIKSKKIESSEEKDAYSTFMRLVFNVKRMLEKLPGGKSRLASYAAALFLLKEKYDLSPVSVDKILRQSGVDQKDFINEETAWYLLDGEQLAPGVYRLREDKLDIIQCQDIANKNDTIRVKEDCYPVEVFLGFKMYVVEHINTGQPLYVTLGEIYR